MANELGLAKNITPISSNVVTAAFGGWLSQVFWPEGAPGNVNTLQFLLQVNFDTATEVEIRPEHATRDAPNDWYPLGELDANDEVVADTFKLVPGSGLPNVDVALIVDASAAIRLNARAVGPGATTTLDAKVTAGPGPS